MTTTPSYVDFYEILQVQPAADDDEIRAAIKNERRTWVKRQSAADPKRRQQAEERVRQIDEAEKVLLNSTSRQNFDRQRANHRPEAAPPAGASGDGDWLQRAQEYLDQGNANFANYAAREATTKDGSSHLGWALRARSSLLLGRTQDAVFEFNEAIRLEPTVPDHHFDLGAVYESASQWNKALECYEAAAKLAPDEPLYRVSIASVYLQNGLPEKALPIMEDVVKAHPDIEPFQYYLANALNDVTMNKLTRLRDNSRVITEPEQIELVKRNIGRAKSLKFDDPDLREMLDHNYGLALDAESIKWRIPGQDAAFGAMAVGADAGCVGGVIVFSLVIAAYFLPVIIGFAIHPALGIIATIGWGWFLVSLARVPGWKAMKLNVKDQIVSTGS